MISVGIWRITCTVIIINCLGNLIDGAPTLTVPSAGNCGDDTILTCTYTGAFPTSRKWFGVNREIMINGAVVRPEDNNKYSETTDTGSNSFSLVIHNTVLHDKGEYRCTTGFDQPSIKQLSFECKSKTATPVVSKAKKLTLTFTDVYPAATSMSVKPTIQASTTVPGSHTCTATSSSMYNCAWTSTSSLGDGDYTYSATVTTITASSPLSTSFKIITPLAPTISNKETISDSREVVRGVEGKSVRLTCISSGGTPEPTVVWYGNSISTTALASTSTGTQQSDGTYTVTLTYTVTSADRTRDDRKSFICRSYYPQATTTATQGSRTSSVLMYLSLKPSTPTVTQSTVTAGDSITVHCRTKNCRPAAAISWLYNGQSTTPNVVSTEDTTTETYAVVSTFRRSVTAADNGQSIKCRVTHSALDTNLTENRILNVTFAVTQGSTGISGNREMTATGSSALTLTCTTGSSNPVSDITWKNGSDPLSSNKPYTDSSGANNGRVRSQQLVLYPTRFMDGDVIMCYVSNSLSQTTVTARVSLNLKYNPIVKITTEHPKSVSEGDTSDAVLSCSAGSKPSSTFTWYHNGNQVSQGSPSNNVFNYYLAPVNRTHYGTYKCKASNGISTDDEEHITVTVLFRPLTVTITGNSNIIADGTNTLTLTCSSGTSNPISDITWRVNNTVITSTASPADENGDYGGKIRRRRLTLKPTRYDDGHVISCAASNALSSGSPATQSVSLDLRYSPLIDSMPDVTVVEGKPNIHLTCKAHSKPPSTFTWYRKSSIVNQGPSTNNQLAYTISNVNRNHAGTYRCNAVNDIGSPDNKNVQLVVQYPPDVTAATTNTTVKESSVDVICTAAGIPDNNYQYKPWVQSWPGYGEVKQWSQTSVLTLSKLTYEHSGTYKCSASNGVEVYGTTTEYMDGTVTLLVKSFPVIISPILLSEEKHRVSAELRMNTAVELTFYLNTEINLKVSCHRNINNSRQPDEVGTIDNTKVQVVLPVFSHKITTQGTKSTLKIVMNQETDFGYYDIVISNEIGTTVLPIETTPLGPPRAPYNVSIGHVQQNTILISWIRGFYGGLAQTFVLEVSTDNSTWTNTTTMPGGTSTSTGLLSKRIESLESSAQYFFRMFAFNDKGRSDYSEVLTFSTEASLVEDSQRDQHTGAIAGCITGGIVLIGLIVLVVVLTRKYQLHVEITCRKRGDPKDDITSNRKDNRTTDQRTDGKDGDSDLPTIEISDSSPQYTSLVNTDTTNMYSSLDNIELREAAPSSRVYENLKIN